MHRLVHSAGTTSIASRDLSTDLSSLIILSVRLMDLWSFCQKRFRKLRAFCYFNVGKPSKFLGPKTPIWNLNSKLLVQ